jgi:hypothetical protein
VVRELRNGRGSGCVRRLGFERHGARWIATQGGYCGPDRRRALTEAALAGLPAWLAAVD